MLFFFSSEKYDIALSLLQKSAFSHQSTSLFLPSTSHLFALSHRTIHFWTARSTTCPQEPHFTKSASRKHSSQSIKCRSSLVFVWTQEGIASTYYGQSRVFALHLPVRYTESAAHPPSSALVHCILREPGQPSGKEAIACICCQTHVYFLLRRH